MNPCGEIFLSNTNPFEVVVAELDPDLNYGYRFMVYFRGEDSGHDTYEVETKMWHIDGKRKVEAFDIASGFKNCYCDTQQVMPFVILVDGKRINTEFAKILVEDRDTLVQLKLSF